MKHKFILFLLFITGTCFFEIQAQVKNGTIIDELETLVVEEGIIRIAADPKITELIGLLSSEINANEKNYLEISGFRIQVFMSNDSRTARKEISDKGSLIKNVFPDIATYTWYVAPNWKLLVGDFMTKEEAEVFKQKIQKSIPELGKEMYVVPDKVNISMQNTY